MKIRLRETMLINKIYWSQGKGEKFLGIKLPGPPENQDLATYQERIGANIQFAHWVENFETEGSFFYQSPISSH